MKTSLKYINPEIPVRSEELPTKKIVSFETIKRVALMIFRELANLLLFPLRYLGAKNWSLPGVVIRTPVILFRHIFYKEPLTKAQFFGTGYHENSSELNVEESKNYLRYVSYGLLPFRHEEDKWAEPFGGKIVAPTTLGIDFSKIPGQVEAKEKSFFDSNNLFKTVVIEDENEMVVTFGPLSSHWHDFDNSDTAKTRVYKLVFSTLLGFAGLDSLQYQQADAIVEQLKERAKQKNKTLVLTGQSLAGALASYAGLKHEVKAICFNSVQLGAGAQYSLGSNRLAKADEFVTHVNVKNEFLFATPLFNVFDKAVSTLGIRTPGNFGQRFHIPSAFDSGRAAHDYPIKSFMKHIGYNQEFLPNQLSLNDRVQSKKMELKCQIT